MSLNAAITPYLSLIDTLRAHGLDRDIEIPQIAVVGDQSSGKSSVLEALTGFPYPRGVGLTTKCPTIVAMRRTEAASPWRAELRFSTLDARQHPQEEAELFDDPEDLTQRLSEIHCGLEIGGQRPSSSSKCRVAVRVFAPGVPDLTLVDLPGIVRTTTAGQSNRVIREVDEMIQEHIRLERTVILAVIPANQDIATVDVLERAHKMDPDGVRTIGVLTKADLVSPGAEEETMAVLRNVKKPLRLGYVIVKNRNQAQIERGMTLEDAKQDEYQFFRHHPVFSRLGKAVVGIEALSEQLTNVLVSRIKSALPSMVQELNQQLKETASALQELGSGPPAEAFQQRVELMQILSRFGALLREAARGEYRDELLIGHPELRLRTAVDGIKKKLQCDLIELRPQFDSEDFRADLRVQLQGLRGREPPGFTNAQFFVNFMTLDMETWRTPIEASVRTTIQTFKRTCRRLIQATAPQYPNIADKVAAAALQSVEQTQDGAFARVDEYLTRHTETLATYDDLLQSINTVRFNAFERALAEVMNKAGDRPAAGAKDAAPLKEMVKSQLGAWYMSTHGVTSEYQVDDVRAVLKAYWAVCAKRVHEEVCMVLDSLLIGATMDRLDQDLMELAHVKSQQDPSLLSRLLAEPLDLTARRDLLEAKRRRLRAALDEIHKMRVDLPSALVPQVHARDHVLLDVPLSAPAVSAGGEDDSWSSPPASARNSDLVEFKLAEATHEFESPRQVFLQPEDTPKSRADMSTDVSSEARPISEPEGLAQAMSDGCVAVFTYTRNGDNRGYVFWLGTAGYLRPFENPHTSGRIRVTSSGMEQGDESVIFSRQKARAWTRSCHDSFIAVDIGRNRYLQLSHVTILHGNPAAGHDLLNYTIEGLDPTDNTWVDLTDGRSTAVASGRVATVALSSRAGAHRKVRLRCTGPQQDGSLRLFVAGLEFYGQLYKQPI